MGKSFEEIEELSQKERHYRLNLNRISEQKLQQKLVELNDQYQKHSLRLRTDKKIEEQRKQIVNITVEKLITERYPSSKQRSSSPSSKNPKQSCQLFCRDCQLYPCQPIYNYTSFITKENDRSIRQRKSSMNNSSLSPHWQKLFSNIEETKSQQGLSHTLRNQYHLVNRHLSMKRTMTRLDEQSRLLRERLMDKKQFVYVKEEQYALKQAIKRHLEISAKFCATN